MFIYSKCAAQQRRFDARKKRTHDESPLFSFFLSFFPEKKNLRDVRDGGRRRTRTRGKANVVLPGPRDDDDDDEDFVWEEKNRWFRFRRRRESQVVVQEHEAFGENDDPLESWGWKK